MIRDYADAVRYWFDWFLLSVAIGVLIALIADFVG